ncbi:MAG: c-type cytochrome [Sphingomonadales bacterium]|nr:c-type cytochrome [Sphingomonadales bacterium]
MRVRLVLTSLLAAGAVLAGTATRAAGPAGDAKVGEALFKARCFMCHSGAPGKPSALAPDLHGVGGRKAASTGFAYSEALKKSGLTWTKANLDTFLTAPQKLVPGTRMVIAVANPKERADVVAYISQLK